MRIWTRIHLHFLIKTDVKKKKENRENFSPDLHRLNSIRYPVSNVHPSPRIAHVNRGEKKRLRGQVVCCPPERLSFFRSSFSK